MSWQSAWPGALDATRTRAAQDQGSLHRLKLAQAAACSSCRVAAAFVDSPVGPIHNRAATSSRLAECRTFCLDSSKSLSRIALLGLSLFLLLLPLTLGKPGLPPTLKADEAAYYLMALSLAHDRDLRLDQQDADRLFDEFHYRHASNVIAMSDDGWQTVYFAKPYLYSLFAAPLVGLFGANGMVFFNMLLTVGMIWLGAFYLSRYNDPATAALFSAGFFLASAGFAYVFWLQPEVFNMFFVTLALFLGLAVSARPTARSRKGPTRAYWQLAASGVALAIASYSKPTHLALGLAVVAPLVIGGQLRDRKLRPRRLLQLGSWALGLVGALALAGALSTALTGHPSTYVGEGVRREGLEICEPGVDPVASVRAAFAAERPSGSVAANDDQFSDDEASVAEARNWSWLFRIPPIELHQTIENVGYFFLGRHTGMLLYFPFTGIALLLFASHSRRSFERWMLLAGLAAVGLFFLLFIDWNWQGGGGFVGNRYFVNVVPGFLFLVTVIRPNWLSAVGLAAAGLLIGPLLLSPFGTPVPRPTLQAHTRNFPLRHFPLELSLRNVPGYHTLNWPGHRIVARQDQAVPRDRGFWVQGAAETEMLWLSVEPLERMVFRLEGFAPRTRVRIRLGDAVEERVLVAGEPQQIELMSLRPDKRRSRSRTRWNVYRFEIESDTGAVRHWTETRPPRACRTFNLADSTDEPFYTGAEVTLLGRAADLANDVFGIEWLEVDGPRTLRAGSRASIPVRLANRSAYPWTQVGAARVRLAYHWLDQNGRVVVRDGLRTELPRALASGAEVGLSIAVQAPTKPGRYTLELDPVYERVAWFSERGVAPQRIPIEVTAP